MSKPLPKLTKKTAIQSILDRIGEQYTVQFDGEIIDGNTWNGFHIKECPGWKFGLWGTKENTNMVEVTYFCQYEKDINKFTPSWSHIKTKLMVCDETDYTFDRFYISDIDYVRNSIHFIKKHPIRAWAEDYYGYMDRCIYVSGYEIFYKWLEYKFEGFKRRAVERILNKRAVHWVKKHIITFINEYPQVDETPIHGVAKIFDYDGYNGYEIIYVVDDNDERPHGFYDWFADDEYDKEICQKFNKLCDKYRAIANLFGVSWSNPFNYSYQYLYEREIPYEIASEV